MYGCRLRNAWFLLVVDHLWREFLNGRNSARSTLACEHGGRQGSIPLPTCGEPVCEAFPWYCADSPIPCEGHYVGHDA